MRSTLDVAERIFGGELEDEPAEAFQNADAHMLPKPLLETVMAHGYLDQILMFIVHLANHGSVDALVQSVLLAGTEESGHAVESAQLEMHLCQKPLVFV